MCADQGIQRWKFRYRSHLLRFSAMEGRKERNVIFNDAINTFLIRL